MRWVQYRCVILSAVGLLSSFSALSADDGSLATPPGECSFQSAPERFLSMQSRIHSDVADQVRKLGAMRASLEAKTIPASKVPIRNFIDEQIFSTMNKAGVEAAQITTDEEFVRRIYLDLTGRIPTPRQIRDFQADTASEKRDVLIDTLLKSPEFTDRWTMWFGDLLQNTANALSTMGFAREIDGRNAFYTYLKTSISNGKSIRDMAWEVIGASGNNYMPEDGAVNFMIGSQATNGPAQDNYDMMLYKSATALLGMSHYDCLACHNGRGHLDLVSVWGKSTTRMDAWRMAAFFSRTRINRPVTSQQLQYINSNYNTTDLFDITTGQYDLNVTYGNRPPRCYNGLPLDPKTNKCPTPPNTAATQVTPAYRGTGATPKSGSWRSAFADNVVSDPMFARNFVNRFWKQLFNLGLAEPVDQLDPGRLDPKNPPPDGWSLQATHPELLEKLAQSFVDNNYSLRETIRMIVQSNAYQLSSRYAGDWSVANVGLFARHYPRRLDGEEIHDAIAQATGNLGKYQIQATIFRNSATDPVKYLPDPVIWAGQLPDSVEPRSNGNVASFMNYFIRGNRDTQPRSQAGSVLEQLALMNDPFVNNRTKISASPTLAAIAKLPNDEAITNEIFLTFLSRLPSDREKNRALNFLSKATTTASKNTAVEDLAWAAINKVDFIFSY